MLIPRSLSMGGEPTVNTKTHHFRTILLAYRKLGGYHNKRSKGLNGHLNIILFVQVHIIVRTTAVFMAGQGMNQDTLK